MNTSELVYPVIVIGKGGIVQVAVDEDALTTDTSYSLKSGWYKQLRIVDSECREVGVRDAVFVCGRGSFWGYTLLLNRVIRLRLSLDEPKPVPFEEVKGRVLKWMKADGRSMPGQDYWRGEMQKASAAKDVPELAEAILPHYDCRTFIRRLKAL